MGFPGGRYLPFSLTPEHPIMTFELVKMADASVKWFLSMQSTKNLMPDNPGLVDFAFGLVDFILHLPDGQLTVLSAFVFEEINLIHHTWENFCRASENDFWASRSWLQLARRARWKIEFLCTLACDTWNFFHMFLNFY